MAQVRRFLKDVEEYDASIEETITIARAVLVQGKPHCVSSERQKLLFAVLDRLRSVSWFTPPQQEILDIFKEKWDEWWRDALGHDWGLFFVREIECIQKRLLDGDVEAVGKWMEKARVRVLGDCPILQIQEYWGK